jgi:hypothetical protein
MSKATYALKLPLSIKKAAQRLEQEDGVSLNQWIASAVAEKVGVMETAAQFSRNAQALRPATGSWSFFTTHPMFLLNLKT